MKHIRAASPRLGAQKDLQFRSGTGFLNSGDKLFCYTDGIFENRGQNNELISEQDILKALNADPSVVVNNNSIQKSMLNA